MASPDTFDPIETYLKAQWTETLLVFENEDYTLPDDPAPWLLVEVFGSFYDQASIGGGEEVEANLWREAGQLYGHVLIPSGTGSRAGRVLAQQFVNLFRGQELGPIRFLGASIGAGAPGDRDGNYFRVTATIDWERDE
jgi:hypothetical protein